MRCRGGRAVVVLQREERDRRGSAEHREQHQEPAHRHILPRLSRPAQRALRGPAEDLGDFERSLHPAGRMAGDGAEVRLGALRQRHDEQARLTRPDHLGLLARDLEVVREGAAVDELEGDPSARNDALREDNLNSFIVTVTVVAFCDVAFVEATGA